jgi:hypothetical protein
MLRLTRRLAGGDEATVFSMTSGDAAGADGSAASARSGADVRAVLLVWAFVFVLCFDFDESSFGDGFGNGFGFRVKNQARLIFSNRP